MSGCNPLSDLLTSASDRAVERTETRLRLSSVQHDMTSGQSVNRSSKTSFLPKSQMGSPISNAAGKSGAVTANISDVGGDITKALGLQKPASITTANNTSLQGPTAALAGQPETAQGLRGSMGHFYKALWELESGKRSTPVTILHLGDAHIAFDRFAGVMRERLQMRFGSAGRGTVLPGYPYPFYRAKGLRFAKNGTWKASSIVNPDAKSPLGLSGVSLTSKGVGAGISMQTLNEPFDWAEIEFLTGPNQGVATIWVTNGGNQFAKRIDLNANAQRPARVKINNAGTSLSVKAETNLPIRILSMRSGLNRPGIRYVNLGLPHATVGSLGYLHSGIFADDLAQIKPDLIILSYGSKDSLDNQLEPGKFRHRLNGFIQAVKAMAPNASFLLTAPPDVATLPRFVRERIKSPANAACRALSAEEKESYAELVKLRHPRLARWHSPIKSNAVRDAIRNVAQINGAHYWDWSKVMGGACGIHSWVHANPPLAAADHIHLTEAGAAKSAEAFFEELMNGYTATKGAFFGAPTKHASAKFPANAN